MNNSQHPKSFKSYFGLLLKIPVSMRITILLLIVIIFQAEANSLYSQSAKVSLNMKNATIEDVLNAIENESEFYFLYNSKLIDVDRKVNINVKSESIESVLKSLFGTTDVICKMEDRQIILSKKEFTKLPTQQQGKRIQGIIRDENGEPVIGANVVEKETANGAITSINGDFSLNVSENAVLQISYIGYITQEVRVGTITFLDIILQEDSRFLDEVVVVGYGIQKKANLTGAVSSVSTDEMGKRQVGQTSLALQGLVPGLSITQRSGQPGADGGTISIRGKTTLGNNEALILVDGVELGIDNVDPSLIESISVLKDAASAAIYGSRAANGVILITTKRADVDKFQVSYNGYAGWQDAAKLPDMVNAIDHMNLINTAYTNTGRSPLYSAEQIEVYKAGMQAYPDKYPDTDWVGETITNNGFMQNHFLTLSGGSKQIRTIASFGYFDQNGILENTNFKRYTFRINTDMEFNKKLSAKIDAHYVLTQRKEPSRDVAFHWISRIPANYAGRLSNGLWGEGWTGDNPIAFTNEGGLRNVESPSATFNFILDYKPTDWLNLQGQFAPKYNETHDKVFRKKIQTYTFDGSEAFASPQKSTMDDTTDKNKRNMLTFTATYDKTFKSTHNVKVLAGYQQDSHTNEGHKGYRENFAFPEYPVLSTGGEENQKSYGWASEWALQSLFGRINYDYKGKYLFEANVRYDGSSRFADGKKWGTFPSFSAGWRISEETFWESLKHTINNLKVRGSHGQLGNQNIGENYPFSSNVNLEGKYVFDKQGVSGGAITDLANRLITWETTTVTDIGLDLTLFGKLHINADYYYKVTDDILLKLDVPLSIGMTAPQQNAGKVENRGWDIGISYAGQMGDFNFRISTNISDVKNKVLDLKGIDETDLLVNREGEEMSSLFGLMADGYITPEDYDSNGTYMGATQYGNFGPGDIKYIDQNNDGVINTSDYVIIGTTIPRYTYGATIYAGYKDFDLNLLLQGVGKANGYIKEQGVIPFYVGGTAQEMHKDYWTEDNRDAQFPRLAFSEVNNIQNSSFWIRNAAYMRLKNVQLGYVIPGKIRNKFSISHLRVYFSGDNLLTFDKFWDAFDVEAPVGNGGFYPPMRTISFGIDLKF
jgi:TonB-linked SusC/RagA family outer membrane protein